MLSAIREYIKNLLHSRIFFLIVIYAILFGILVGRLFYLQIVKGESYEKQASIKNEKRRILKSSRGKIYDCNGKLLASNEQSYSITIEDSGDFGKDVAAMNQMILKCISLIEKNGDSLSVDFPIAFNKKGNIVFNGDDNAILVFKREIFHLKSTKELSDEQKKMTAEDMFNYIKNSSGSNKLNFFDSEKEADLDNESALKIMTVRYALMMNMYKKYESVVISSDVSMKTVCAIKENTPILPGVEVSEDTKRVYYDSYYFSHIIGYTGAISSDVLDEKQESGDDFYTASDQIGKSGIENKYEEQLRGKKGSETLVVDSSSRIVATKLNEEAQAGEDIYLTIDSKLQKAAYKLTEKTVAGVLISKLNNSKSAGTKGKKAEDIRVPIYDVYCAILENGLVDISKFNEKGSSELEKDIYSHFSIQKKKTMASIKTSLAGKTDIIGDKMSKSMREYYDYVYQMLRSKEIIATSKMDQSNTTYKKYANGRIPLSSFLDFAISNNWLDLSKLKISQDYFSKDEIYDKLMEFVVNELQNDSNFDKKIYHQLVYNDKISGREVCLLMYEQGYFDHDKNMEARLRTGMINPFDFIKKKLKTLELVPGELGLTPCSASVVITDPNTGDVKAMVSYPSYDNNKFANKVNADYYNKINSSSASPLLNRATQQKTAPGSTYKMVTATAALEEGIIDPYTKVTDHVVFSKVNPSPKCWSSAGHGTINVSQAIQHSCNYFFYEMGYKLSGHNGDVVHHENGLKKLENYADLYGLSDVSGVEISEVTPNISDTDAVRSAIGQGTNSFTPTQLSRYVSTIANGGTCYDLTLVDKIVNPITGKTQDNKAHTRNKVEFSSKTFDAIKKGMYLVANTGSLESVFANVPKKVAGKTGTAQISANEPNHALFVSFAPYTNPEISVSVVIPNAYTSANAASLASYIYKYYFDKSSRKSLLKNQATNPTHSSGAVAD